MRFLQAVAVVALLLTAVVFQNTGLGQATVLGVHPDYTMVVVAAIGASRGRELGAVAGFLGGLAVDAFVTTPFGLSAIVYVVVGYLAGEVEQIDGGVPFAVRWLVVGLVSLLGEALFVVAEFLLGLTNPLHARVLAQIVVVGGVNLIVAPVALGLARLAFGSSQPRVA